MAVIVPTATGGPKKVGGDSTVERDGMGRPRIIVGCQVCDGSGTVPSPKTGNQIKCQPCKGAGAGKKASYTRVTTFIDVLDSKDNIMAWKSRKVLQGVAMDPTLLDTVLAHDDAEREGRDHLNRLAEIAADKGGASDAASRGDRLHDLSEIVDLRKKIPADSTDEDRAYVEAYSEATSDLVRIHLVERLVVNDFLKVAGTPDRVSTPLRPLVTPDGTVIHEDERIITDLKTGRVDYGRLKMAMQLSIYSRSPLYLPDGTRKPIPRLRTDWGIIMHLPAVPEGEQPRLHLYWADLSAGWEATLLARDIRSARSAERSALVPFE